MMKVLGLGMLLMLAMNAAAAAAGCSAPGVNPVDNGTVDATMQAPSGKACGWHFHRSFGPTYGFELLQRPSHGAVRFANSNIVYQSRPGYVGGDSFTWAERGLTWTGAPSMRKVNVTVTVMP